MSQCIACAKNENLLTFTVQEIQTLHIRDINGEKRVQAAALMQNYAVCRACALARLESILHPRKDMAETAIVFGAIFASGIALMLFFRSQGPLFMLGLGAVGCGVLGGGGTLHNITAKRKTIRLLSAEDALHFAAWECLVSCAPKKTDDADLTYIPVNAKTLSMKMGDLALQYDLLPAVAVRVVDLLHKEAEGKKEKKIEGKQKNTSS